MGSEDPALAPTLGAFSLGLRPTPHGSASHFYCNPGQTSVAGKVIGPEAESVIAFLINDDIIKLSVLIRIDLGCFQPRLKKLPLPWAVVNGEMHN